MKYDFVAIGDITTDAFIQLKDARVNCDIDDKNCLLCVRFGDKIPYENVTEVRAVGNSPNAAVSAHRLGLKSALATNLGDDRNGDDCMDALRKEGLPTAFVRVHNGIGTNYHYVLRYEAERTILVKHHEYQYALPTFQEPPAWIYLSSLGENSLPFHQEIVDYVQQHNVKLAFQPGTFQMKLGLEKLKHVYTATEIFFCNKQEAKLILNTKEDDIPTLITMMREQGPKQVVITDGPQGAFGGNSDGSWFVPMYPDPAPPVDRTGAGDASSSTITAFLAAGEPLAEALLRGPINSMSVVQHIGAQKGLLTREELDTYLAQAPANYKARKVA